MAEHLFGGSDESSYPCGVYGVISEMMLCICVAATGVALLVRPEFGYWLSAVLGIVLVLLVCFAMTALSASPWR
jgi:hypothetical protein